MLACPPRALADGDEAEARTTFEPGRGLVVVSHDDLFSLTLRVRAQFLYTLEDEDDDPAQHGLQIRRARVAFGGHIFSRNIRYKTELALSPRDEDLQIGEGPIRTPLLDSYVDFSHFRNAVFRVGQYKVPWNRQRVISSADLQMVDRALAQTEFNLDRDIGFDLRSEDLAGLGRFRYYAGVWFNQGRDAIALTTFDQMYIVRFECLPLGLFEDYVEADLERNPTPKISLGAAYAYLDDARTERGILGDRPADLGTTNMHVGTVDAMWKWRGSSALTELYVRDGRRSPGGAVDEGGQPVPVAAPRDGFGWFVQGGYLLPEPALEIVARYSGVRGFGDDSSLPEQHEIGAGLSLYIAGHPLKLQADFFHIWLANDFDGGRHVLRVQLQAGY